LLNGGNTKNKYRHKTNLGDSYLTHKYFLMLSLSMVLMRAHPWNFSPTNMFVLHISE